MEGATGTLWVQEISLPWKRADLKMPCEQRQNHVSDLYQAVPAAVTKCHSLGGFSQEKMYLSLSWRLRVKTKVFGFSWDGVS